MTINFFSHPQLIIYWSDYVTSKPNQCVIGTELQK